MAQWTVIDPNTLLPGDPWTSAKAQAAFENVEALAEGAEGAPRVQARGLSPFLLGKLAESGTDASGFMDLDPLTVIRFDAYFSGGTLFSDPPIIQPRNLEMRVSANNGSSWTSWFNLGLSRTRGVYFGYLDLLSGSFVGSVHDFGVSSDDTARLNPENISINFSETDINAFQIRLNGTGGYVAAATYTSRAEA